MMEMVASTDTESYDDDVEDSHLDDLLESCQGDQHRLEDVRQQLHQCYMVVKRRWGKSLGRPTGNRRSQFRKAPRGEGIGKKKFKKREKKI